MKRKEEERGTQPDTDKHRQTQNRRHAPTHTHARTLLLALQMAFELNDVPTDDKVVLPVYFFHRSTWGTQTRLRDPALVVVPRTTTTKHLRAVANDLVRLVPGDGL